MVNEDYFIKLTLSLYKVTDLFPEEEPLRFLIRKKANEILSSLILIFSDNPISVKREKKIILSQEVLEDIKVLRGFFEIAKKQNWVSELNFLVLRREYDKIDKAIACNTESYEAVREEKRNDSKIRDDKASNSFQFNGLRERRFKKILELVQTKGSAQVKDAETLFPEISKRTLRRDFEYLLNKGLLKREGNGNMAAYRLVGHP